MNYEKATLSTLGNGVAEELFQREFDLVVKDIRDVNTEAKAKRKITLEVQIEPTDNREIGEAQIKCTSKLAGVKPASATIHIDGQDKAFVNNLKQETLDNVIDLGGEK